MKPIRILHIMGAMNRGGAETLVMELYRNIDRDLVQFDFLVHGEGVFDQEINRLGGKIYYLQNRFIKNPYLYLKEIYTFFIHHNYQIVHSHLNEMSGYILWMAKKAKIIYRISHIHTKQPKTDFIRNLLWKFGKRLANHYSSYIFGCSQDAIQYFCNFATDNKKKVVIRNAIQIDKFIFNHQAREKIRRELNIDESTTLIGNVGRFENVKNHISVLKIFKKLLVYNPNYLLLLIGDGSLKSKIQTETKKSNIDSKVIFLGVRDDVCDLYNAMDVFLFPSLFEGLGIVLIEAQINGLPCIASDTIPKEADLCLNLVTFISLKEDIKKWVDIVLKSKRVYLTEENVKLSAKESGYDIRDVSEWLQSFYLHLTI